jgi:hypothetical protein
VKPNPDLLVHQQQDAADTKVLRDAADSEAADSVVVWEQVVAVAVKSMSPTFVTSYPFH